ncbi:RNA 2',3'-cyclic phosphodiesterase [Aquicella siphonis]|uniref:RNA 2',3'-cyclic phosphodiesterase n=1 Tax=Aquicella siphonis TaxID=254247 RepID=A0A5E4PEM8_9COXI|nr:RNA 2',3'-cyclic phosphodiesterase [Aquicella siphonis]VVC74786.1 RNA 2',3'-cyclic phosphodiesterase [Aquicella siphonis]
MMLPPVIRIFFAVDLPESAREKLGGFIAVLKKKSRTHGIRWTRPENLHITLQFLAEVQTEHLPALIENVRARIEKTMNSLQISLGSLHLFPNPYRPRVIVLDVFPQEGLFSLSSQIGEGIKATRYEIESRPFRAHLTLGRIKQPHGINLGFLNECEVPKFEILPVREVVLFRSEPQPEGSAYSVLERIALNAAADSKSLL